MSPSPSSSEKDHHHDRNGDRSLDRTGLWVMLAMEMRYHATRPMLWVLLLVVVLVTWGLAAGNLTISSGDSTIGGQARAHINSEFALAQMFPLLTFLLYSLFVAVAAGMAIPEDEELQVIPVVHATRLRPEHYIWAKFLGVVLFFLGVLGAHLVVTILFFQFLPHPEEDLIRGAFSWIAYLRPAMILSLPFLVFLCGVSIAIGEWTRKPLLVFLIPVAFYVVSLFFLWEWSPSWLDPRINRWLMWIEPSGFRWLNETWLKIDRGVGFYNHQPVVYDLRFLLSRLIYGGLGILAAALSSRRFARNLRGSTHPAPRRWRWSLPKRRQSAAGTMTGGATTSPWDILRERPIAALAMKSGVPGFFRSTFDVARFEARNLFAQPGLYLFVPLILLQTIGSSSLEVGAFEVPVLLTPGVAAVEAMNTLTLLVCLLLLFYTVESVTREWRTGLAPMFFSAPAKTSALLSGKALANSIVGVSILLATYLGLAIVMVVQDKVTPSAGPFLLVWGLLLVPTFLVWTAFAIALLALTGNRYTTYGLGLGALVGTGWLQLTGKMTWVGNWNLWDAVTWTDFGSVDPNATALALNRLFWLAVAGVLVAMTVRVFPRRQPDSGRTLDRLRPRPLLRLGWKLLPTLVPAVVLGLTLWVQTTRGFQSEGAQKRDEDYRGRNLLTWAAAKTPHLLAVDLDLTLDPDDNYFQVSGQYRMVNPHDIPLQRVPMSVGDHFKDLQWTLNGVDAEPEDWARMMVFNLAEPLPPGGELIVKFSHHGRLPDGLTSNGGGLSQFILPSGVVLTSFTSTFVPIPYFDMERGVDDDNRLEPRSYEEGFWHGRTPPALASGGRFQVRTRITGPSRFLYHGVGIRRSEEVVGDLRTVVWQTDHPVNFFNVVAGPWEVWEGDGVEIYHLPEHRYNLEEMGEALVAARRYYSEWFYPYPWQDLKLSEFPGIASYAQGFPTNITFSESIGFLTRSSEASRAAFLVTAHEAAHQWWGNILLPGEGPGGNVLSEGMAHFSTALLVEQVKGPEARMEFLKRIEERYGDNRRVDSERPLVWTDDSKEGDETVVYDKGGWVFWMLLDHMGREAGLAGFQDFINRYAESDDYPLLQDFIAVLREHAAYPEAFDTFVDRWFFQVLVPRFQIESAVVAPVRGGFEVEVTLGQTGGDRVEVEVAVTRGQRFSEDSAAEPWRESRISLVLEDGESRTVVLPADFEPERLILDPDVRLLMLDRAQTERDL